MRQAGVLVNLTVTHAMLRQMINGAKTICLTGILVFVNMGPGVYIMILYVAANQMRILLVSIKVSIVPVIAMETYVIEKQLPILFWFAVLL